MKIQIIAARLETTNFEFVAYGFNTQAVKKLLKNAFEAHIEKTGGWLTWADVECDVWCEEVIPNSVTIR